MKLKALLYCTKRKPYIGCHTEYNGERKQENGYRVFTTHNFENKPYFNGKIVAECEVETEEFDFASERFYTIGTNGHFDVTKKEDIERYNELVRKYNVEISKQKTLLAKSCLNAVELVTYLDKECLGKENLKGYALHISNLKVFDNPLELSECKIIRNYEYCSIESSVLDAPQNMMRVWHNGERKVLISIRPEWVCKILNGEKIIEVRKKVLKGMVD